MKNGFIKVAAASPYVIPADPMSNTKELIRLTQDASAAGVHILVFPELCITGYTCGDLFLSETLLKGAKDALKSFLAATGDTDTVAIVGLPYACDGELYDCAAVCQRGKLLGIVPKCELPDHGAFSERRWFTSASDLLFGDVEFEGEKVPFGAYHMFSCSAPSFTFGVQVGAYALMSNHPTRLVTLVCNPTATPTLVGSEEGSRRSVLDYSARTLTACITASAGEGESTTDLVFGGHCLIAENGTLLAEAPAFAEAGRLVITEIDVDRLNAERRRNTLYQATDVYKPIKVVFPVTETLITRKISPTPFIPEDACERRTRMETILSIQARGLGQRMQRAHAKCAVLGISGGLDSTLALLVAVRAMDAAGRPRKDILAVTMPCFGTTERTKTNATVLCEELGVELRTVDIFDAVKQHFSDIGHDPEVRDVTYENSQARERTQILMDMANDCNGLVVGTGDLSELALGWATYNGDHMSSYAVNSDIPKTLVRYLVAHSAEQYEAQGREALASALRDILATPVSPELLPAETDGSIAQKTEDLVGPYELHDFYLYYLLRYGCSPTKLYRLAKLSMEGRYSDEELKKWLRVLLRRFFTQQFKRSCMPDGPKVGSVGLSPRGDWKMPSDASPALWLKEADEL